MPKERTSQVEANAKERASWREWQADQDHGPKTKSQQRERRR